MESIGPGLYDDLLTAALRAEIDVLKGENLPVILGRLDDGQLPEYLTRLLAAQLFSAFRVLGKDVRKQGDLANTVIEGVARYDQDLAFLLKERLRCEDLAEVLQEVKEKGDNRKASIRPEAPLSVSTLFTGARGLPQLGREIECELATADRCDMLVAFVKVGGINLLMPALSEFTERGGQLRVITTSYLGASDPVAIERLRALKNTEIKISYDTKHARLHAKTYFFHRNTDLSSAYIGSANLSHIAMTKGLEWTVKIAKRELPDLFRRCETEFSGYWENGEYEDFKTEEHSDRFREAIRRERGSDGGSSELQVLFDLRPYDFQQEVLDKLEEARETRGHFRNLVVAATGTGKTMIAAFDYLRIAANCDGGRPRLLFIAHRQEILRQGMASFRGVLRDGNFGELLYSGKNPEKFEYLFCSIQTFEGRRLWEEFGVDYWDYVVVDETHHGEASSYRNVLNLLAPKILLGLTATPERGDGTSIDYLFNRPYAAEIRLPEALQKKLLCPFHYFAVSDHTIDFTELSWKRGKYDDAELSNLVTGNTKRAQLVVDALRKYLPDPFNGEDFDREAVCGLGFCVSQDHAEFMASEFKRAGIPAEALDSNTASDDRLRLRRKLESGELNFLFVIDIFNEGVDIPKINCVLFLRPTESHVVYLQQFGRGLRHASGKENLTVLDFVAQCRKEFRYDLRFLHLLPTRRRSLIEELENGFPHLPAGCSIQLERQARDVILESVRRTYESLEVRVLEGLAPWQGGEAPGLSTFLDQVGENPLDLFRLKTWSEWKAAAGFCGDPADGDLGKKQLRQSLWRLSLKQTRGYLHGIRSVLEDGDTETNAYVPLVHELIWNDRGGAVGVDSFAESIAKIRENETIAADLGEVLEWCEGRMIAGPEKTFQCPKVLEIHEVYSSNEIQAAFGLVDLEKKGSKGTGLVTAHSHKTLIHLVTFEKTERHFSASTMYRDYPVKRNVLHWESQSVATQEGKIGRLYRDHVAEGYTILFFARVRKQVGKGLTAPFLFLGAGRFLEWEGERPIAITWEMSHEMPMEFFREAQAVCGLE